MEIPERREIVVRVPVQQFTQQGRVRVGAHGFDQQDHVVLLGFGQGVGERLADERLVETVFRIVYGMQTHIGSM